MEEAKELLKFAKSVAWSVAHSTDCVELAGYAVATALASYDATTGVPVKRWVALHTKQAIYNFWRRKARRQEEQRSEEYWFDEVEAPAEEPFVELDPNDRMLLHERYVERIPVDVLARDRQITVYEVRKRIAAATQRLLQAV